MNRISADKLAAVLHGWASLAGPQAIAALANVSQPTVKTACDKAGVKSLLLYRNMPIRVPAGDIRVEYHRGAIRGAPPLGVLLGFDVVTNLGLAFAVGDGPASVTAFLSDLTAKTGVTFPPPCDPETYFDGLAKAAGEPPQWFHEAGRLTYVDEKALTEFVAFRLLYHNFCQGKSTPAMAAGLAVAPWPVTRLAE